MNKEEKTQITDLIESVMKLEFTEKRESDTRSLWVSDLSKDPKQVAKQLLEKTPVSFSNYGYSLGNSIEYILTTNIKRKLTENQLDQFKHFNLIDFGSTQQKIQLSYMELGLSFAGKIDFMFYTKNGNKVPTEIKSLSAKRFYDKDVLNKEKIQLLAYINGIQVDYGILIRINRDNGFYQILTVLKDDKIKSYASKTPVPFYVYVRHWATKFHQAKAELALKQG